MKIILKEKTENGKKVLIELYKGSSSVTLRLIKGVVSVINDDPYTLQIDQKQWKSISANMIKSNKYLYNTTIFPFKEILKDLGAEETDIEIEVK